MSHPRSPRSRTSNHADDIRLAAEFESVLRDLAAQVQRLEHASTERREAMRRADPRGLARCTERENAIVQEITEVEKRRLAVVTKLAEAHGLKEKSQARASDVARAVGGTTGERLAARAESLREKLTALFKQNESVKAAAQHLAAHMDGLWKQASGALNHARTYARTGAITPGAAVISALDVRS